MTCNGTGNPPWRTYGLAPTAQQRRAEGADTFSTEGVNTAKGKVVPGQVASAKGPFISKTLTQWFTPGSGPAMQFGFLTFDRAETVVESGWDDARQAPVVSAWTDFPGV